MCVYVYRDPCADVFMHAYMGFMYIGIFHIIIKTSSLLQKGKKTENNAMILGVSWTI